MENLLTNQLPSSVYVGGLKYQFNTNFRDFIKFSILLEDEDILDLEKIGISLKLFYGDQPIFMDNYQEAMEQIFYMYMCGQEVRDTEKNNNASSSSAQIYSFKYDDKYIYAAFMQAYNIDLFRIEMHWWCFKALFDGLPEDTLFRKILTYRSIKIDSKMSDGEKKHYKEMKRVFALPDTRTQIEKEQSFVDALGL